jgi:hypothetical protein
MNIVADMLLAQPAPLAIWAVLMLLTFPAMLLLGSPEGARHPRRVAREVLELLRERGDRRTVLAARAGEAVQYAQELRAAAEQSAAGAQRWRELSQRREQHSAAAWQAWLDADARLRTLRAAAVWKLSWSAPTCAEYAERERYLHRAVAAAAERGELPAAAVADAVAGRNGWDARLHAAEQELVIARVSAAWLRSRFAEATTAERTARHDAELAARTAVSLRAEAETATTRAAQLTELLPARLRTATPATRRAVAVPALS